jgi:ParB family chromosome partitioning protein
MPCIVRELTDDEAVLIMVDSNLQREKVLPSERAFAYKMKLEAMKRQGQRTDLTSDPVGPKFQNRSNEKLAGEVGDSASQIKRYIRLTNLIPPLLDMVDEEKIAFRPAVELSYLSQSEQQSLLDTMSFEDATPSLAQAIKMKEFSKDGRLNEDVILSIMSEEKPNQREKYTFQADRLRQYIPTGYSRQQTEEYVVKALAHYQRFLERQRDRER